MGCGISTMDANNASKVGRRFNGRLRHQHAAVPRPIVDNNKKYNDDDDNDQEVTKKNEGFLENSLKEKKIVVDRKDQEERVEFIERPGKLEQDNVSNGLKNVGGENNNDNNDNYRDDFIGHGSPSFREYCTDYDSVDRNSMVDSNDYTESGESMKNSSSDEDSAKPGNEKSSHSSKEPDKKERRGRRGFRNAMHKRKARGGRRNLLNFACYNSSTQSYAEGSLNKIVAKST